MVSVTLGLTEKEVDDSLGRGTGGADQLHAQNNGHYAATGWIVSKTTEQTACMSHSGSRSTVFVIK